MWLLIGKALLTGSTVVAVSEIAGRMPRLGGFLLSLPLISIIAFIMTWSISPKPEVINNLAQEMLILIPLTLIFYVPFLFVNQINFSFWMALVLGIFLTLILVGMCFWLRSS
jgi:hypothetical protein